MPLDKQYGMRLKNLMETISALSPKLADEAQQTGDFSKVEKANMTLEKLAGLGDRFTSSIGQDAGGPETFTNDLNAPEADQPNTEDELPPDPPVTKPPVPTPSLMQRAKGTLGGMVGPVGRDMAQRGADTLSSMVPKIPTSGTEAQPVEQKPEIPVTIGSFETEKSEPMLKRLKTDEPVSESTRQLYAPENNNMESEKQDGPVTPEKVMAVAPKIEEQFGGDPQAFLADFEANLGELSNKEGVDRSWNIPKSKDGPSGPSDAEREFLRRVKLEIGERPKAFTITKLLAALTVGAGSILAGYLKGRYEGQALLDVGEEGRHWDDKRAMIGREVASQHYGMNKMREMQDAIGGRLSQLEMGRNVRDEMNRGSREFIAGNREEGQDRRAEGREGGLDRRADQRWDRSDEQQRVAETGKNTRQKAWLDAKVAMFDKLQLTKSRVQRWSQSDQQEAMRHRAVMRDIMQDEAKQQAAEQALIQLEAKNRDKGR